jgi:hypothetical protein
MAGPRTGVQSQGPFLEETAVSKTFLADITAKGDHEQRH